jgi:hypothetical protein
VKRKNKILSIVYTILIIVLTVLAIGGSILIRRFEYVAGTRNDGYYSFTHAFGLSMILFFIMASIAICASILALISLVLRHSNIGQILFKLVLLILGPVIAFCAFECISPLSPVFLEGLEQWVIQETDIDAIQMWLASEGSKHIGRHFNAENGFPEGLPDCLVDLKPKLISFGNSDSQNGPTVEITWFLFMDNYGLIVGPPEMETPKKGRIKLHRNYYEFRRPVKRGAYVFIRG